MSHSYRLVLMLLLAAVTAPFVTGLARATPFPGSIVQVGPWRLGAYTHGQDTAFDACAIYRVQNDGFGFYVGERTGGVRGVSVEAADWGLTPNQDYTTSFTIGSNSFTFGGHAINVRMLSLKVSPEFLTGLRSGVLLGATANQRHFTISLDGIETALARLKDCVQQYAGRTLAPAQAAPPQATPPPATPSAAAPPKPAGQGGMFSGTGFYIDTNTLITNFHVINGCTALRLAKNGVTVGHVRMIAYSASDDLVALHTEQPAQSFLKLRTGAPIRAAESVLVFGYPLAGALSSAGNTTLGNVTALAGLRDDSRYIQISASIQLGNSGGPVIDDSGRLMGVVVSKLNAMAVAKVTGDIPQNVNFAIKASTLASFLEAHGISYQADTTAHELSSVQRGERAETSSIRIECRK
jgi:S1-C subfamily serine protease